MLALGRGGTTGPCLMVPVPRGTVVGGRLVVAAPGAAVLAVGVAGSSSSPQWPSPATFQPDGTTRS